MGSSANRLQRRAPSVRTRLEVASQRLRPKGASRPPVSYEDFRTGLTYQDVYQELWSYSDDRRTWLKGKGRRTVLGRWREIKKRLYAEYENAWYQAKTTRHRKLAVPF